MNTCGDCAYFVALADETRGYCIMCPPRPTGEYRGEAAQWTIVLASHIECDQCMCRMGCGEVIPPIEFFLLKEDGEYVLQEDDGKFILEGP